MSGASPPAGRTVSSIGSTALLASSLALLGVLTSVPALLGPALGVAAPLVAGWLRGRRNFAARSVAISIPLGALVVLAIASPPVPTSELVGGFASLAFLFWIADDPLRAPGGARRAAPTIAVIGLVFAVALTLGLGLPSIRYELGVAGVLAAVALLAVGAALAHSSAPPAGAAATD